MQKIDQHISRSLKEIQAKSRPKATTGFWLLPLLPIAVIISAIKHPLECSYTYKISATLSIGMILISLIFLMQCIREKQPFKIKAIYLLPGALVSAIFIVTFQRDYKYSILHGFSATLGYFHLLKYILTRLPQSFTFGEAAMAAQALILFMSSSADKIMVAFKSTPYKVLDVASIIIQVGLIAIGTICLLCSTFRKLRQPKSFYVLSFVCILFLLVLPLHVILKQSPLVWLFAMFLKNPSTMNVLLYWLLCTAIATLAVSRQISGAKKASTIVRKVFHLLAFAVYTPGLIFECTLLYLASGVVLGIFIFLEVLRILKIPPLGQRLEDGFMVFCDEKDAGVIALTPIYLLVGCSLPIWLHPAPCDLMDSAGYYLLPLMSGLLSIGVGDTMASVFGTVIGKHKWPGTNKTVEGTIFCVLGQAIVIFVLIYLDLVLKGHLYMIKLGIAVIAVSLIEARTSQVDNLVLPLIMYIILI